jgi:hypothetical protein
LTFHQRDLVCGRMRPRCHDNSIIYGTKVIDADQPRDCGRLSLSSTLKGRSSLDVALFTDRLLSLFSSFLFAYLAIMFLYSILGLALSVTTLAHQGHGGRNPARRGHYRPQRRHNNETTSRFNLTDLYKGQSFFECVNISLRLCPSLTLLHHAVPGTSSLSPTLRMEW